MIGNSVIVAVSFMAYGLFRPDTPLLVIYAVLLAGGFFQVSSVHQPQRNDVRRRRLTHR